MQPLSIDLRLLAELPGSGLRLTPGRGLMARVMQADGSGRGVLNIAGAVIEAQLPRHIRAGEQLRLTVRHLDAQRVVLELPRDPAAAAPAPPAVALPGGGRLRVQAEEGGESDRGGGSGRGRETVSLSYDTPALGTLDLRFELRGDGLRVTVAAPPGRALELARSQASELREALLRTGDRPATVTVTARRETLDLYA
jgi:hypothetical protein